MSFPTREEARAAALRQIAEDGGGEMIACVGPPRCQRTADQQTAAMNDGSCALCERLYVHPETRA